MLKVDSPRMCFYTPIECCEGSQRKVGHSLLILLRTCEVADFVWHPYSELSFYSHYVEEKKMHVFLFQLLTSQSPDIS